MQLKARFRAHIVYCYLLLSTGLVVLRVARTGFSSVDKLRLLELRKWYLFAIVAFIVTDAHAEAAYRLLNYCRRRRCSTYSGNCDDDSF